MQNYAAAYIKAAEKLLELGRTDEAVRATEDALKLTANPTIIYSSGVIYYRIEQFLRAEKAFRELAERGYGDFQVVRLLGRSIERQGRFEEAEAVYKIGFERYPDDQEALREIFSFYMERNEAQKAKQALEQWVRRHPADDAARGRLQQLKDSL